MFVEYSPPHPGTKFPMMNKGVRWLPHEVWLDEKDKEQKDINKIKAEPEKYHKGVKNKPIFDSTVHYTAKTSLTQAYTDFVISKIEAEFKLAGKSKAELVSKLLPLTDWQKGVGLKMSWVFYANNHKADGTKEFGLQEITTGTKGKLDEICVREQKGQHVTVDLFSNPDKGKAVQITYKPKETDNKKKYSATLLFEKDWVLTDEELEAWSKLDSLDKLYGKSVFKYKDFQKEIAGLEILDRQNGYGVIGTPAWEAKFLEIVQFYPPKPEEDEEDDELDVTKESSNSSTKKEIEKPVSFLPDDLDGLSKPNLLNFITQFEIGIEKPRPTHSSERIASDIRTFIANENKISGDKLQKEIDDLVSQFKQNNEEGDNSNQKESNPDALIDTSKVVKKEITTDLRSKYA